VDPSKTRITRPIFLTREAGSLKLAFSYNPAIVEKVKTLPYASFDGDTNAWSVDLTKQAVEILRQWFYTEGLTDVYVDELLNPNEVLPEAYPAILRPGTLKRPYVVLMGFRDESLFVRLRSVPGAQWEKKMRGLSYPATSAAALSELVQRGVIHDTQRVLTPSNITVTFDGRTGVFKVLGDSRAQTAFMRNFPSRDIVSDWRAKGFDVGFVNQFAEEVYRGERARITKAVQPVGLLEPLFEYQCLNVAVAVERTGFGVWDQPGLGKTATAIGWAWELIVNRKSADRVIIVVPGTIKTQFASEITRFTGDTDIVIVDGDKKKRIDQYKCAANARWVILNYELLHLDYQFIQPLVAGSLLVADEAHRLKTRTSKRTKAMRQLALKASRRLALSGTPIENNPGEWYNLMNGFVVPGIFGSPLEFFNRYSYPGRFGGFEGARNLGELQLRSNPHYIRHRKSEVAKHLPPLLVKNEIIDPDERLAAALKRAHRDAQEEIAQAAKDKKKLGILDGELEDIIETGAAMTAVGMLRLMCSSPKLIWQSTAPSAIALCQAGLIPDIDGPKLDELRLMVAELQEAGERVVVFTGFRSMAKLIAERFDQDSIRYVLFTGHTSKKDRELSVLKFNTASTETDPGPTVFLATDAGSEGLNLGKCCSTIINFDLAFKPSTMTQRANRIHRVDGDPTKRYLVINFTLAKTIEEGIIKLVGTKADLSDAILGEMGTRKSATGRGGRNVYEQALESWQEAAK
jgi:hypothetical protein